MLPLLLSVGLIVFWAVVGRALLALFAPRLGVLRSWLLAPTAGLAVQVIVVSVLSQAGLAENGFARPVLAALLAAGIAVLAWRRPAVPARALAPYAIITVLFLAWAGSPWFKFGFNWVSYVNDDYTNYTLSAERFRQFGFYHPPTLADLTGWDYRQYYFFMHALALMRFGSEQAVAFVAALVRINSLRVFMSLILALAVAQITAAAGLILHWGRWRRVALLASVLLAASPLFIFGALYQLISQVGGLALMITVLALLAAPVPPRGRLRLLARAVPAGVVGAALALFYPETSPFAVLAYVLFFGLEWLRTRRFPAARAVMLEYTLIVWMVALRFNLVGYLYTLGNQAASGLGQADLSLSLFPFFLIPSGLSSLFGFQPMNVQLSEPLGSLTILLGFILLVAVAIFACRYSWQCAPMAVLLLVQLGLGVRLFQLGADFGIYKLAMYIQPALMAGLAAMLWAALRKPGRVALGALVLIVLITPAARRYIAASEGSTANGMTEMQQASAHLMRRPALQPGARWDSGIDNVVAAKMAANFYAGSDVHFLARDFFQVLTFLLGADWPLMSAYPHPALYALGDKLLAERNTEVFLKGSLFGSPFIFQASKRAPTAYLELPNQLSLFNKFGAPPDRGNLFDLIPAASVHDRLVFVHSQLGNHYYLGDRRRISFLQQEADPYRPGGAMNGIGRFFLFRVERPTGPIYVRIEATKTFMGPDNKLWSKQAVVEGAEDRPMGLRGGGAVNRFIGPVDPVEYRDGAYIALDFAQQPKQFPSTRHGLEGWYNREVPLDYRRLVAFGRDISAISVADYNRLSRPTEISRFPDDLLNAAGLEFSGIYEDGWLSPDSEFVLAGSRSGQAVRLTGFVPRMPGLKPEGQLTVVVNGTETLSFPAPAGAFDWLIPIEHPQGLTRIRLKFSSSAKFAPPDSRLVAAKLDRLAIVRPSNPIDITRGPRLPSVGIDGDGWAARRCAIWIPTGTEASALALSVEYPGWAGLPPTCPLTIHIEGQPDRVQTLKAGLNRVVVEVRPGESAVRVGLEAGRDFALPAPDGRVRAMRLRSFSVIAPGPI